jgi:hypothetical protein
MFPNYQQYALNEQQRINKQVADALVKKYSNEELNTDDFSQQASILYHQLERKMIILVSLTLEAMSHITDNPNYTFPTTGTGNNSTSTKNTNKTFEESSDPPILGKKRQLKVNFKNPKKHRKGLSGGSNQNKYNHDNVFVGTLQSIDTTLVDIQQIVNQLTESFNYLEKGQVIRIDNLLSNLYQRITDLVSIFSNAHSKTDVNSSYKEDLIDDILNKFNTIYETLNNMIDNYSPISNLDD